MSVKYLQVISDFLMNRDNPSEYTNCLSTMYERFTISDEFNEMTQPQKNDLLNKVRELKTLISNIIAVNETPLEAEKSPQ